MYLPWEGYIFRGTFQAESVPKIRAGINRSLRKVLLNFQVSFQPFMSLIVFMIDYYSKNQFKCGVEGCFL